MPFFKVFSYFKAMFTHDMVESGQKEIKIQGIEAEILEILINFSYSGKIRINSGNVQAIHVGAAFLQMKRICDSCSRFLIRRLYSQNVLAIR